MTSRRGSGERAAAGAAVALVTQHLLRRATSGDPSRWERQNHRGRTVSLLSGPALAIAAACTTSLPVAPAAVAALGSAAVGAYDDAVGDASAKGLRGHLGALRRGRVTSGSIKIAGIGASALVAGALADRRSSPGSGAGHVLLGAAVVAASANLLNLLDLRPGRALKAGTAAALLLGQPGPAGAAAGLLRDDLGERTMLGDAGANALGAVLGLALAQRHPTRRSSALVLLTVVTGASELVSFSRVIDAVPPLRWVDRAGRRP